MQVEVKLARSITPDRIETQWRPIGGAVTWSQSVQAQLTTPMPENLRQTSVGESSAAGAMPTLRAEVIATHPALVLKIVSAVGQSPPLSTQTAVAGSREWLGQQFRQHWPESRPVAATLDRIAAQLATEISATPSPALASADAIQIQRAITTLIGQLATVAELSNPEQLAMAVNRSGLWLEALLAQAAIDPARSSELTLDLKAQLITFAQRIRLHGARPPTPADPGVAAPSPKGLQRLASLAHEAEGMVKQVVTKQLQSLDSSAGQNQWLLELPFRTPSGLSTLEADIRRERAREDTEHDLWTMRLRLDLPKLGPLNILLIWRDARLNASLQAADPEAAERIGKHLGELRARLKAREIDVASLHAGHRPFDRPAPPFDDLMVREQA